MDDQTHSTQQSQEQQDNELPTYEQLAEQAGPNSRFGRWRGWVEKRAAERYADDTPERQLARRMKGWGPHAVVESAEPPPPPFPADEPPTPQGTLSRTHTVLSSLYTEPESESPLPITSVQSLPPSHIQLHTFGSRFLPHTEEPILSLLPICNDTMLLIGHTDGLSVLHLDADVPTEDIGAAEPKRYDIWRGQGVYQLDILEYEQSSSNTPKGVVLALVGTEPPENGSDKENKGPHKAIRMYSLASLVNLARWACTRKEKDCLDAKGLKDWQGSRKGKLRTTRSSKPENIVTPIKLTVTSPDEGTPPPLPPKPGWTPPSPNRTSTIGSEWDVVETGDLPIQWLTDYVPLATPGSKLINQSVLFFELLRSSGRSRVTARLAVATRQNILVYETVRGERAFRFVKEFYTPLPARSATFIYQGLYETGPRSANTLYHTSTWTSDAQVGLLTSASSHQSRRVSSPPGPILNPPRTAQLSLFVVFEKKAGLIRISDSSVGEIDLWESSSTSHSRRASTQIASTLRLSIGASLDGLSLSGRESKGLWVAPAEVNFPFYMVPYDDDGVTLYLLTRGKTTHVLPSPLPLPLSSAPPLKILKWNSTPSRIVPRACEKRITGEPLLQVIAFTEDGVEVQEHPLTFLDATTRLKGKARDETVTVYADVGPGGAGFLCRGGHWSEQTRARPSLLRQGSTSTMDTIEMVERSLREQGIYAWTQKGFNDWRVFWLGGSAEDDIPPSSP